MSNIKTYIIKTDPSLGIPKGDYFFKRVQEILSLPMPTNWSGHEFKYIGHDEKYNDPELTPESKSYNVIIVLLERKTKHKLLELTGSTLHDQPKTDGFGKPIDFERTEFSYTFHSVPILITIDETNWSSAYKQLGIKKEEYEQYVIFHEIGHSIGKDHKPIPDDVTKPYPIMYQATLGLPDLTRFKPYPNESD